MRSKAGLSLLFLGIMGALLFVGHQSVAASSANLSHSYKSTEKLSAGDIVTLDSENSDRVIGANIDNGKGLLGVVVDLNDSLLAIDPNANGVQVAVSGSAYALVSDLNGEIKAGDRVALSPFTGIGMKSVPGARVVGLAQSSFSSSSTGAQSQEVRDKQGKTTRISVGFVQVNVAVGTDTSDGGAARLSSLQKLARSLTGHTISTARLIISLMVALLAFISLVTLIYSSIYGSIISVGRNPLAKYAIFRTLGSVMAMAILTTVIAAITIFFLLR